MKFPSPLIHGVLERRYKRFLADVRLDSGEVVTAHCANSGSMMGVKEPGSEVWLSPATNPARKLRYSWELIRVGDGLVGINTSHPNLLVSEAVTAGLIAPLNGYATLRREVKYGQNSRIDLLLEDHPCAPNCYVEVKNVTLMRQPGLAEFPDAVTARGTKHLTELTEMVNQGYRAVMFYLVQREDCHSFALAHDIDSAYSAAFTQARAKGVEILCYQCNITLGGISVGAALAI